MKNVTNKKAITIKSTGTVIPAGTKLTIVSFNSDATRRPSMTISTPSGETFKSCNFPNYFTPPSIKTLTKWSDDGVGKSVTGKRCELDGYGDDDSPSWLLAMGMI